MRNFVPLADGEHTVAATCWSQASRLNLHLAGWKPDFAFPCRRNSTPQPGCSP
jgi:hypothetical protein